MNLRPLPVVRLAFNPVKTWTQSRIIRTIDVYLHMRPRVTPRPGKVAEEINKLVMVTKCCSPTYMLSKMAA